MLKWIKGIAIFLGLVILLFVSGLGVAVFYETEILNEVNVALKSAVQADIQIEDAEFTFLADFPNLTLRLENVKMSSADTARKHLEFFKTERININIRTYKLLFKEVHFRSFMIEDGEIFIFRTAKGYSNIDGLKRNETDRVERTEGVIQLSDGKIFFERCRFVYADSLKRKYFSFNLKETRSNLSYTDSVADFTLEGAINFEALQFNPSRGSFLKETAAMVNLKLRYYLTAGQLFLETSEVALEKSLVNLKGQFDFSKERKVTLTIRSDNLHYQEGLTVIPESLATRLSVMEVQKPFRFILNLEAPLKPNVLPAVDIQFVLHNNVFKSHDINITHLSLNGTMTNHVNDRLPFDNQNSLVQLNDIKGRIDDLPFQAEASLVDLSDMELKLHSTHRLTLRQLNKDVDTTRFRFLRGHFSSEFTYQGKLSEYLNKSAGRYLGKLKGQSTIEDGSFLFVSRKLTLNKINAFIRFTEDSVWINNLSLTTGKSAVQIGGLITNFVPFFVQPLQKGIVKLEIRSPSIDLASVLVKKSSKKTSARQKKIEKKKVSDMLDGVFRNLQFDVTLKAEKLRHGNFNVAKVSGRLRMTGTTLEARDLKMNYGGGQLSINAVMKNLDKDVNPVEVKAVTTNVRIRDLFRSFDNFSQKVITDENLEGTITLNSTFRTRINDDFIVHMPSLRGQVNMTIRDGRLVNVGAFRKMSNFLFKRRDFEDVKFAQINAKFGVSNRDLDISRMEIQSTVLSLFLDGTYSLDDRADLTIQVPLSNLRKRDKSYVPKNVGLDAKVGPSVFLRAVTNANGVTEISYDLFRNKKKKEESKRKK